MKRILIISNLILLAGVVVLGGLLGAERSANRRLTQALNNSAATVQELQAAQERTNDMHEACRARINELTRSFNSAADQLIAMSMRMRELEAQVKAEAPPLAGSPASGPGMPGAPSLTSAGARPGPQPGPHLFETLYGTNHQALGWNLEFSGVYGRRVAFKEAGSSRRVAFDVDQIDPKALALLGIDPEAQKALQVRQDKAWQQAEATSLAMALAEEQRRRDQEATRAEAERKRLEQLQAQAASQSGAADNQAAPAPDGSPAPPQGGYGINPYPPMPPVPFWYPPWWYRPRPW